MKGLFLNNFYSSVENIKLFSIVVLAVGAATLVTGNPTAQELFVYITVTAFSANAVVSSRKDAASNWNKFEITLPVRRTDIVKSKYLTCLFWLAVGTVLALAVTLVTALIHKGGNLPCETGLLQIEHLASMFVLGIGISLFTVALFFPLAYLTDIDKSETVLIISVLSAIGLSVLILNVLNRFLAAFTARMIVFVMIYLAFLAGSCLLSLNLYSKKEFR